MSATELRQVQEAGGNTMRAVLSHRYGNGQVYIRPGQRPAFDEAIRQGLIDADGYLTALGRTWLADHGAL